MIKEVHKIIDEYMKENSISEIKITASYSLTNESLTVNTYEK